MRNMKNFQGCSYLFFPLLKGNITSKLHARGVESICSSRKSLIQKSWLSHYGLRQMNLSLAHWQMPGMSLLPMAMRFMTKPVPAPHGWASLPGQPPGSFQPDEEAAHRQCGRFGSSGVEHSI